MKVYGGKGATPVDLYIEKMLNKKRNEEKPAVEASHEPEPKDNVQISRAGAEINKVRESVKNTPDVRTPRTGQRAAFLTLSDPLRASVAAMRRLPS